MTPDWAMLLPWNMLSSAAKTYGLDVNLVAAIVMQETAGMPWATKFEPAYIYLVTPSAWAVKRGITEITEITHQKTSWGLMQVMGGVAREIGYAGDLPELARPAVGLRWACQKFKANVDRLGVRSTEDIVAAWNGGPGGIKKNADGSYASPQVQKYVVSVMRLYSAIAPAGS